MKKAVGVISAVVLFVGTVAGQVPFFKQYYLLKKNEPVQINVILQDRTGYVWLGTNRGLFRFDGLDYRRFTRSDSLPDESITSLALDSAGRVWFGCQNGKIAYFDKDAVVKFNPPEGSSSQPISDLLFDNRGRLWFSTLNDGLYYLVEGRLYRIDDQEGLPDLFIYDIEQDANGRIWAGTDGGLAICTLKDRKVDVKVIDDHHGLPDNIVKKIHRDNDLMWIATEDAGIMSVDVATSAVKKLTTNWPYGTIGDFVFHGDRFWIAAPGSGLVVVDHKTNETRLYNPSAGSAFTSINTLLRDQEGNVWTGTKTGVSRTLGDRLEYIETAGLGRDVNVMAVAVDGQGDVWYSNNEGLFHRKVDSRANVITTQPLAHTPYQKHTIISLYVDDNGYIWAGLYGEGAIRIDPHTSQTRYFNTELRNGNILSITGKGNAVWLATLGGGTKITSAGSQLSVKNYSSLDGLSNDYIYQVFVDSQGRVWFATDGKGVDRLDPDGFRHFEKGLNSKVVYGFAEDGEHNIWINVQGEGLYRLDGDTFKPLSSEAALRDNNINGLAADRAGNLIVIHDLGIDILDVRKNRVRLLADETSIHNKKANLNAVTRDVHGHLLIGTDGGIIRYSDVGPQEFASPVPFVSTFSVFDKAFDFQKPQTFHYDENNITIGYSGFWFQNPESLNFQYKLDNYDRDWISRRDHSVTYSSLPPGQYVFRLRVSDSPDFTGAREATITFEIMPPFWQRIWFYVMTAIAAVIIGYNYILYRERKLQENNKILEAKVKERTLEIQKKNEEIQAQNEEIHAQTEEIRGINENLEMLVKARTQELEKKNKSLEEYAFISAHELRAPVASILGLVNLMRQVNLKPDERVYLEHLEKSADKLDTVCNSITRAIEKGDV